MEPQDAEDSCLGAGGSISRRALIKSAAILAAAGSLPSRANASDDNPSGTFFAYVGTYTPNGQGIHLFSFDASTGALTQIKVAAAVQNPSWLALNPNGLFLYAVNEIANFGGSNAGSVSSFSKASISAWVL